MPQTGRKFKDAIYEQLVRIGKALASPGRLELLDLLCQGPRTVEALAREGRRVRPGAAAEALACGQLRSSRAAVPAVASNRSKSPSSTRSSRPLRQPLRRPLTSGSGRSR